MVDDPNKRIVDAVRDLVEATAYAPDDTRIRVSQGGGRGSGAYNERVKLAASALNTLATGTFLAGVLGPVVASFYGFGSQPQLVDLGEIVVGSVIWFSVALVLHGLGLLVLGSMKDT